jgi:hypothetical protein
MFKVKKFVLLGLWVILFGSLSALAQDDLGETVDNGLVALDYPSGWIFDAFTSETEDGALEPVIFLYSEQAVQDMIMAGAGFVLDAGQGVVLVNAVEDDSTSLEAAMDAFLETQGGEDDAQLGEITPFDTDAFEGLRVSLTADEGAGVIGMLGDGEVLVEFIMLAGEDSLDEFDETFEAILASIRRSERDSDGDEASDEASDTSDQDDDDALAYGDSVVGFMTRDNGDEWTFEGRAGDIITISMTALALDSYLEVFDPNGDPIAEDDDGGRGLNALIEGLELELDGTYTILARTAGGMGRGEYTLILVEGDSFTGLPAGVIAIGEAIEGVLPIGTQQSYRFVGQAGVEVTITLESDDLSMDPYLELRSADGDLLAEDDDSAGSLNARIEDFELPEDGEYQIVVRTAGGFGGGEYTLTLR